MNIGTSGGSVFVWIMRLMTDLENIRSVFVTDAKVDNDTHLVLVLRLGQIKVSWPVGVCRLETLSRHNSIPSNRRH